MCGPRQALTPLPTRSTGPFDLHCKAQTPDYRATNHRRHIVEQYAVSPPDGKYVLKEAQKWCSDIIAFQ